MFKFELGELIYYLENNKVHSAPVLSRMIVENSREENNDTEEQRAFYMRFGSTRTLYSTCHGIISEEEAFGSKEDLAKDLIKG